MKSLVLLAALIGLGIAAQFAPAEEKKDAKAPESQVLTGVLIDNTCAAKKTDEAAAAQHPLSCNLNKGCAGSGFQLMVADKRYKFDDKGSEKAKAYLEKADSTHVIVEGKLENEKLVVTSIKAAPKPATKPTTSEAM